MEIKIIKLKSLTIDRFKMDEKIKSRSKATNKET